MNTATDQHDDLATYINITARQRMLSYKLFACISMAKADLTDGIAKEFATARETYLSGHKLISALPPRLGDAGPGAEKALSVVVPFASWVQGLTIEGAVALDQSVLEQRMIGGMVDQIAALNKIIQAIEDSLADTARQKDGESRDSLGLVSAIAQDLLDIGGKINLIALNARIEAARQNEEGRAFAVIANEIKALSELSREKANAINDHVNGIKTIEAA